MNKEEDKIKEEMKQMDELLSSDVKWEQVSNLNTIVAYLHCGMCLKETGDKSYQPWLEVGWTKWGIQVWCRIHEVNIMHMNFDDIKHKADSSRQYKKDELT